MKKIMLIALINFALFAGPSADFIGVDRLGRPVVQDLDTKKCFIIQGDEAMLPCSCKAVVKKKNR